MGSADAALAITLTQSFPENYQHGEDLLQQKLYIHVAIDTVVMTTKRLGVVFRIQPLTWSSCVLVDDNI